MAQDDTAAPRPSPAVGRILLFGGVAGAALLGAGLGLWARPVEGEQPGAVKPQVVAEAPMAATDRRLHVVVDNHPAPLAQPAGMAPVATGPANANPVLTPERRPPAPLMRIAAPMLAALIPTHARPAAERAPAEKPAPIPTMVPPKPLPVVELRADAEAPKPVEPRRIRTAQAAHPAPVARPKTVKLAKAQPKHVHAKPRDDDDEEVAAAPATSKSHRALLELAHVISRIAPHHLKVEVDADSAPKHAKKASLREVHMTKPPAKKPPRFEHYIPPLNTKGANPIRVSSVITRCASPDPGEALVCGDPALGAAQRRLNRIYQEAVAAGVPQATLEQQQQRWLAARAAAAREAPWAVREVYQARIAELQDMTREARGN